MVSSIASVQQPTISIPEVGTIDLSGYQVDAARWNEFQIFEISGESLKLVSELLGFSARFESDEVRTAWLDIFDSSARATLEVSRNARPHTLAVRYQADSWYSIDATPGTTERNTGSFSRADYESAKLENQSLNRLAEILGLEPDFQKSAFIRVNFKTMKVAVLSSSSDSGGAGTKPIEANSLNDGKVNDMETTSLELLESVDQPRELEQVNRPTVQSESANISAAPITRPNTAPHCATVNPATAVTPRYETYSRSEVDRLLKMEAEKITSSVLTKVGSQSKNTKESLKNQDFAIKQALDTATKKMSQAQAIMEASASQLRDENSKELENLRKSLFSELNQFKKQIERDVYPKLERSEKKMDQKHEKGSKDEQPLVKAGINLNIIYAVIALIVLANSLLIWSAYDRLNKLEESQADLPKLTTEEVPLPDMIGDQMKKEASSQASPLSPQLQAPPQVQSTPQLQSAPQLQAQPQSQPATQTQPSTPLQPAAKP